MAYKPLLMCLSFLFIMPIRNKSKLITGLSVDQPDTVMCNVGKSIYHLLWNKTSVWICFGCMRRILIYILTVLFFNWCCFCAIFITPCECFSAGWFLQQLSAMCWKFTLAFLWLKVLFFQKGNSERFTHCDFFSSGKKKKTTTRTKDHIESCMSYVHYYSNAKLWEEKR